MTSHRNPQAIIDGLQSSIHNLQLPNSAEAANALDAAYLIIAAYRDLQHAAIDLANAFQEDVAWWKPVDPERGDRINPALARLTIASGGTVTPKESK